MFKSLKDKLKGALSKFSKKVEEEAEPVDKKHEKEKKKDSVEEHVQEEVKEHVEDEVIEEHVEESEVKEVEISEPKKVEVVEHEVQEVVEKKEKKPSVKDVEKAIEEIAKLEPEKEKKGFFSKIKEKVTTVELSGDRFEDLFWPLEMTLMENNVAVEVIEKIKTDMHEGLVSKRLSRKEIDNIVLGTLKSSIEELFEVEGPDLLKKVKEKKPYVIAFIGVNGAGKTTSMAKVANLFQKNNLSCVFAAADTFRAASMEQLQEHADKLKIKMIKHDYKSDPAAVAFDAIEHAKAKKIDVVLIDTAGRLHSNKNLMQELEKLIRVNEPDLKIFVGESTTGNDCVEQAREFDSAVGIDVIILTKADVDEKGGAAISISFVTGKPIIYLGTGQTYDDLTKFDKKIVMENLF